MTPEFKEFLIVLRRQYLAMVDSLEKLLGMKPKCPHCDRFLRD